MTAANQQVYQVIPYDLFKSFLEDNNKSFDDILKDNEGLVSYINVEERPMHEVSNFPDSQKENNMPPPSAICITPEINMSAMCTIPENNNEHLKADETINKVSDSVHADIPAVTSNKKSTGKATFPCDICNRELNSRWSLSLHRRIHTGERPFVCEKCGSKFTRADSLSRHRRSHQSAISEAVRTEVAGVNDKNSNLINTNAKVGHSCDICGLKLSSRCRLITHRRIHTGERPYVCHICTSAFSRIDQLKNHIRSHNPEKLYTCTTCGQKLSTRKSLDSHARMHARENAILNAVNARVNESEHNSELSIMSHPDDRPYACNICFASFKQTSALNSHIKTHMDERPYRCQFCGLSFKRKDCMMSHERMHTGEKPFPCQYCGLRFSRRSSMVSHELIHTGEKPYSCGVCKKAFRLSAALKNHTCVPRESALTIGSDNT